jgi:endonuclease/exonuclease/phosphatase family metal-dependent hydrolase
MIRIISSTWRLGTLIATCAIALPGCQSVGLRADNSTPQTLSAPIEASTLLREKVSVLTFNVENLFDTEDDPERDDETFLPAEMKLDAIVQNKCRSQGGAPHHIRDCLSKNWSPEVLARKLSRLADVLRQTEGGRGPDILILQEVESREVLERWQKEHLKDMGYQTLVHLKGPDQRGISNAILSRLPLIDTPKLHDINVADLSDLKKPTRGILEAHLKLPTGDPLAVFAVHFPSQGAPTPFRKRAIERLLQVTGEVPKGTPILVGGDFNISSREDYAQRFFSDTLAQKFFASHLIGCEKCMGTIFYPKDGTWSFFDVLLFSPNLVEDRDSSWRVDRSSIQVVNSSVYQMSRFGTPARFGSGRAPIGVSDHWPMYAELKLKKERAQ